MRIKRHEEGGRGKSQFRNIIFMNLHVFKMYGMFNVHIRHVAKCAMRLIIDASFGFLNLRVYFYNYHRLRMFLAVWLLPCEHVLRSFCPSASHDSCPFSIYLIISSRVTFVFAELLLILEFIRKHARTPCKHGGQASRQIDTASRLEASIACGIQHGEINRL